MIDERALLERALKQFPPENGIVERVHRRRERKRRNERIAAAALALVLAAAAIGLTLRVLERAREARPAGSGSRIVDRIDVGGPAGAVAVGDGAVWVIDNPDSEVVRVDPGSDEVVASIQIEDPFLQSVTAGDGVVWAQGTDLHEIDPSTNEVIADVPGMDAVHPYLFDGSLWISNYGDGTVSRLDEHTGEVQASIPVPGNDPHGIAAAGGSIWVAVDDAGFVLRIDPATNQIVDTIAVEETPSAVVAAAGAVWVATTHAVQRIDPATGVVTATTRVAASAQPNGIGGDDSTVWVAVTDYGRTDLQTPQGPIKGTALRLDPTTGLVVEEVALPEEGYEVAVGEGGVWVVGGEDPGRLIRIELA